MVVVRKDQKPRPQPVKKSARHISFFDWVREEYAMDPVSPDTEGMNEKAAGRAMREHRELIDDLRLDYYIEVADGNITEPEDFVDKRSVVERLRALLPAQWTKNEGKNARDLCLGMELKLDLKSATLWVVDHASPAGVTIQLISGPLEPHFTTARRVIIAVRSSIYYRRQTATTISRMDSITDHNKSRLTE